MQTGGVLDIVTCGKQALPVPDHEIAAIKLIVESKLPARPWPFLKVGQRVKIQQGSLAGLEGVLLSIKKNLNVVVSIEMLQRSVAVEIEGDWIEPTSPLCLSDIA